MPWRPPSTQPWWRVMPLKTPPQHHPAQKNCSYDGFNDHLLATCFQTTYAGTSERKHTTRVLTQNHTYPQVIAFQSPLGDQAHVLVRRVAAGEGHEMISDDPDETSFRLPPGTCWVLADNDTLEPQQVIDSRSFGPLPYEHIVGRVLYHARSTHDHGVVENSEEAMAADAPVLAAELDVDGLLSGEMEELEKQ